MVKSVKLISNSSECDYTVMFGASSIHGVCVGNCRALLAAAKCRAIPICIE
jgi:hypothetical protein